MQTIDLICLGKLNVEEKQQTTKEAPCKPLT